MMSVVKMLLLWDVKNTKANQSDEGGSRVTAFMTRSLRYSTVCQQHKVFLV